MTACSKIKKKRKLRRLILDRDGPNCYYCGLSFDLLDLPLPPKHSPGHALARQQAAMTIEHLVPVSQGGELSLENCVLAHQFCNLAAGDMSLEDKQALRQKFREAIARRACASA